MSKASRPAELLGLGKPPIAIGFFESPPPGVPRWESGPVAAGCMFWEKAMSGQTFYTAPSDHYNCAVGSYTHRIALPAERAHELNDTIVFMAQNNYVATAEVPGIPTLARSPGAVAYGPVDAAGFKPDVVLIAAKPAQAMLIYEAAIKAGAGSALTNALGRPACAILPLTMASSQTSISLGCKGNRTFTGLPDEEMYVAIPGDKWEAVVEKLAEAHEANVAMGRYYSNRKDAALAMKRVLLLLPTTGYRNSDFLAAAKKLGVEIVAAANYCHQLAPTWGLSPIMALHFDRPEQAADTLLREINATPDAVLAVDDSGVELAAMLSERLGLPGNPAQAVRRVRDKLAFRRLLQEGEFLCPEFHHLPTGEDARKLLPELKFPVVVKARRLSGSRGVIRANDPEELMRAVNWVRAIQTRADRDAQELGLIIEDFIPGREYALEGSLQRGELTTLALFDKPDPLDGPYFEETLYITPSRLPEALQDRIHQEVARACRAAELMTGPVHAEVRVNDRGLWILEVAARSIGGLCGRVLIHLLGMSLEELILRQVVAESLPISLPAAIDAAGEGGAAGVMMIPIPRRGIYRGLEGLAAAQSVRGVTGVAITAEPGQIVAPPPDGASYLGFIFARAPSPANAESALRIAHRRLHFDIRPEYPATVAPAAKRP